MQLVIGNKNYSSWSMRPWVLMRHFGLSFEERKLRLDGFDTASQFKQQIAPLSPAGHVPVLIDDDLVVWDSLAIAEYLAEKFPAPGLWPANMKQRARARAVCAEMHSGFSALRAHLPMNVEALLPEVGPRVLAAEPALRNDLARLLTLWQDALQSCGGPFLFGPFSIADAYYAPVVVRLRSYAIPVPPYIAAYMERVLESPGVAAWIRDAQEEGDFLPHEEPYRDAR